MTIPMKTYLLAVSLGCANYASAAVVLAPSTTVDWLTFAAGPSTLADRNGIAIASVVLGVAQGDVFPGALEPQNLDAAYWQDEVPFDSVGNPASAVESLRVHVFPGTASTVFTLTIRALSGNFQGTILALGGLDIGSTSLLRVAGSHSVLGPAAGSFSYLGDCSGNPGFGAFDKPFLWNATNMTLSPLAGPAGETAFAFLELQSSGIDTISMEFTSTSPLPFGDAFFAAVGTSIPEPAFPLLVALGFVALSWRRRDL